MLQLIPLEAEAFCYEARIIIGRTCSTDISFHLTYADHFLRFFKRVRALPKIPQHAALAVVVEHSLVALCLLSPDAFDIFLHCDWCVGPMLQSDPEEFRIGNSALQGL